MAHTSQSNYLAINYNKMISITDSISLMASAIRCFNLPI
ncbi:hypothetical protein FORC065_2628 [Yersinia enterocolitica]|nr:hypothetical protein FORC065_2628 [Yersinia enterocolitica]